MESVLKQLNYRYINSTDHRMMRHSFVIRATLYNVNTNVIITRTKERHVNTTNLYSDNFNNGVNFGRVNIAWSPLIHSIEVNIVWKVCSNNLTTAT